MSQNAAPPPGWPGPQSPFHATELLAQQHAGVREMADRSGRRGIRTYMPEQHREFYATLPFLVLGGLDAQGQPWATIRAGEPGFVSSPDPCTLRIGGAALPGDPLAGTWLPGAMVGGLGIQPQTRRRNRVNGVVSAADGDAFTLRVSQSFGNCAQYIQRRTPVPVARTPSASRARVLRAGALSDADRSLLARADTFFVASANADASAGMSGGADVSHRGGLPGFVQVGDDGAITVPDYSGNRFFNTIGNLLHDPRAGLLFVDLASGDILYLVVTAEVIWEGPELSAFQGAQRLLRFRVREARRTPGAMPFAWSDVEYAPEFGRTAQTAGAAGRQQQLMPGSVMATVLPLPPGSCC